MKFAGRLVQAARDARPAVAEYTVTGGDAENRAGRVSPDLDRGQLRLQEGQSRSAAARRYGVPAQVVNRLVGAGGSTPGQAAGPGRSRAARLTAST